MMVVELVVVLTALRLVTVCVCVRGQSTVIEIDTNAACGVCREMICIYILSTTLVTIGHLQVISEWPIVRNSKWMHARTFRNIP